MHWQKLLMIAAIGSTLILCFVEAGPVRSLALNGIGRGAKIPRSIRAPFGNTQMMTARGFGKRSFIGQGGGFFAEPHELAWSYIKDSEDEADDTVENGLTGDAFDRSGIKRSRNINKIFGGSPPIMVARDYGKRSDNIDLLKLLNESNDAGINGKNHILLKTYDNSQEGGRKFNEFSIPLEWLVTEVSSNPNLARLVLQKFVDANKDGILTSHELSGNSVLSNDNNDAY